MGYEAACGEPLSETLEGLCCASLPHLDHIPHGSGVLGGCRDPVLLCPLVQEVHTATHSISHTRGVAMSEARGAFGSPSIDALDSYRLSDGACDLT